MKLNKTIARISEIFPNNRTFPQHFVRLEGDFALFLASRPTKRLNLPERISVNYLCQHWHWKALTPAENELRIFFSYENVVSTFNDRRECLRASHFTWDGRPVTFDNILSENTIFLCRFVELRRVFIFTQTVIRVFPQQTRLTPLTHASLLNKHQTKRVYSINWHSLCCLTFAAASSTRVAFYCQNRSEFLGQLCLFPPICSLYQRFFFLCAFAETHHCAAFTVRFTQKHERNQARANFLCSILFYNQKIVLLSFNFAAFLHCAMCKPFSFPHLYRTFTYLALNEWSA